MRLLFFAVLVLPAVCFGWGFDGHRKLASMMQDPLPANLCLRAWLLSHQTTALQDSACDPDRARCPGSATCDPLEWPRHYLDVDYANPPSSYPREYAQVEQQMGMVYAQKNGQVPWRVEAQYALLVTAFRSKDPTQILNTAFFFSHYVTDAFSLLHDTKNFDPNGLHLRWESDMLQSTANVSSIAALAAGSYFGTPGKADPRNNIFDVVLAGTAQVGSLYAADLATTSADGGSHDMSAFYQQAKDLTARRWGDAATMLSSLVWSAWAEAGAPQLTGFASGCSMAVPTNEIVLKGFPVPGGFVHTDGGWPGVPDAGAPDSGSATGGGAGGNSGGGAGGSTGGGSEAVGGGGQAPGSGCSCGLPGAAWLGALALLLARARRR